MQCISQEIVEDTWQTIASMKPEDAGVAMFHFSEAQPHLLAFVLAFSEDLNSDASELCTYMLYVVYQMFANAATEPIPVITEKQVETQFNATCDLLENMHDEDAISDEEVELEIQNQPFIYQYISEALQEEIEDESDRMDISEEEFGEIFMMMKCVIDAVDLATN